MALARHAPVIALGCLRREGPQVGDQAAGAVRGLATRIDFSAARVFAAPATTTNPANLCGHSTSSLGPLFTQAGQLYPPSSARHRRTTA